MGIWKWKQGNVRETTKVSQFPQVFWNPFALAKLLACNY